MVLLVCRLLTVLFFLLAGWINTCLSSAYIKGTKHEGRDYLESLCKSAYFNPDRMMVGSGGQWDINDSV